MSRNTLNKISVASKTITYLTAIAIIFTAKVHANKI